MKFITLTLFLLLSGCSFRHIGCLGMYEGEQVELLKYLGNNMYLVKPDRGDTSLRFIIDSRDLE